MTLDAEGGSGSIRAVSKAAHLISVMPLFRRFPISRCICSFTPSYEIQRSDLLYCLHFFFLFGEFRYSLISVQVIL